MGSTNYTIATFQGLGKGTNTLLDSASSLNGSYELNVGSSSRNAGTSIETIRSAFLTDFSVALSRDIFGNDRVSTIPIDIGAHEAA